MGFITNLFKGQQEYTAQAGLQPGQLEQTYQQQQDALKQMAAFAAAAQGMGGLQNLGQVFQQQQDLASQLQAMGQGQGPSAAQAMLQQQAGDIAAQQAAIMGSQRGASQNVGLIGRQAAAAGMGAQQRAASQAAILRQQEQLSALEQLRQQQAQMGQIAGAQAEQARLGTGALGQAALQAQQQALQAQAQQEQARTSMAETKERTRGGILGSTMEFAGKLVPKAEGGEIKPEEAFDIVEFLNAVKPMAHGEKVPGKAKVKGDSYSNDTVPALLSPGEIVVPRSAAKDPEKAAAFAKSVAMRSKRKKK